MHIKSYLDPDLPAGPIDFESIYARSSANLLFGACFPPNDIRRMQAFCLDLEQIRDMIDTAQDTVVWKDKEYRFGSFIFWNEEVIEVGTKDFNAFIKRLNAAKQK